MAVQKRRQPVITMKEIKQIPTTISISMDKPALDGTDKWALLQDGADNGYLHVITWISVRGAAS